MGEHNSEKQVMRKTERDMFAISPTEREKIVVPMMNAFKISESEATVRAQMMKKFTLTHAKRLGKSVNTVLDLIAEGSLIPSNTVMPYDKPVSDYLLRYDVEAQNRKDGGNLVLHLKFDFMGKKFRVIVTNEKFAAKKFGEIMTAKEIADVAKNAEGEKKGGE